MQISAKGQWRGIFWRFVDIGLRGRMVDNDPCSIGTSNIGRLGCTVSFSEELETCGGGRICCIYFFETR